MRIGILQHGLHDLVLFLPGLVIGALFLRLGRFFQLQSAGKTWSPAKSRKDSAKAKDAANTYKGLGLIFMGALTVDAWWNYSVIVGAVVTFVLIAEIWLVIRWRREESSRAIASCAADRPH